MVEFATIASEVQEEYGDSAADSLEDVVEEASVGLEAVLDEIEDEVGADASPMDVYAEANSDDESEEYSASDYTSCDDSYDDLPGKSLPYETPEEALNEDNPVNIAYESSNALYAFVSYNAGELYSESNSDVMSEYNNGTCL